MGVFGWSPAEFWSSTMHDFNAALEGFSVLQGDRKWVDEALVTELKPKMEAFKAGKLKIGAP